jgi:hypothetical protein
VTVLRLVQGKLPGVESCLKETLDRQLVVDHEDAREIGLLLFVLHGMYSFTVNCDDFVGATRQVAL